MEKYLKLPFQHRYTISFDNNPGMYGCILPHLSLINNTNINNSYCGITGTLISCCGCKVDCWKEEGPCSLLAFINPFAIIAFTLSCCSIAGVLVIISICGFIGLRNESQKFFIILSVVNLIASLFSLPILSIILFPNIQWLRLAPHVVQVLMILNQYFATSSFFWTMIINLHLYYLVKYGSEALRWNKFFHLIVWILAVLSTIPIIVGIYSNNDFPMFVPTTDLHIELLVDIQDILVVPSITTDKFVEELHKITNILQLLTFGALVLWVANILSSILIKIALNKFFKHQCLEDDKLKKGFGVDTSLITVSQLLIFAQIPGLIFGWWLYFSFHEWQNPIIIQSSFTFGASLQGLFNSIYYLAKKEVRLQVQALLKPLPNVGINDNEDSSEILLVHE